MDEKLPQLSSPEQPVSPPLDLDITKLKVADVMQMADNIIERVATHYRRDAEENTMLDKLELEQEHQVKMKELEQRPRQERNRYFFAAFVILLLMGGFVLAIAYGKDQVALDALKLIGLIGGLGFGLYQYGLRKGEKKSKNDEEE
jgi:hypothetical protein